MIKYEKNCIRSPTKQKTHKEKEVIYNDTIITFDIEVTSGWILNGKVIPFDKSKNKKFYEPLEKTSLCYIWQASIEDVVYYDRYLETFVDFLEEVEEKFDGKKIIWVHNLSYEFQFLLNLFEFTKIFARTPHKVIYAEKDNFTFRCSYFLTRLSLEKWAIDKKLPVKKLDGDLNYLKIRTPLTQLTEDELNYCEHDCLVVYHGIKQYLDRYKHLNKIPLTQTGEVRKEVKKILHGNYKHFKKCTELLPSNAYEYARLKECFAGGWTHANYTYSGKILRNVTSKDIASSYPTVMIAYKYPYSKWQKVKSINDFNNSDYSMILDVTLKGIISKYENNYISYNKCYYTKNVAKDNGRIIKADEIRMVLTNVDYNIIVNTYEIKTIEINDVWVSINQYLPTEFVKFILKLYGDKTTLKGIKEFESQYATSKQFINSLFGMSVTAILQENVIFSNNEWQVETMDIEAINTGLDKLREKPYKNFLAYQWGVWVTAYARRALWTPIQEIDEDVIYCDTDSIKYMGNHDEVFNRYNEKIVHDLETACKFHNIDTELLRPKDRNGVSHQIGIFEDDGKYEEFITLGAKRYAFKKDGKLNITVSGVSKKTGAKALNNSLKNFNENLEFNYDESGKLISTYLNNQSDIVWNVGECDEYSSKYKYGINMQPTTYTMSITDEYLDLMAQADLIKTNLDFDAKELHQISTKAVATTQQKGST